MLDRRGQPTPRVFVAPLPSGLAEMVLAACNAPGFNDVDPNRQGGLTGAFFMPITESPGSQPDFRQLETAPAPARLSYPHSHIPDAATPKHGPSAGIALWAAMLSAYLDRPLRSDIAMTGELSLTGDVWPVGGVKAKLLAAERAGLREVILPADNKADAPLNTSLTLHWVTSCEDILPILFPATT